MLIRTLCYYIAITIYWHKIRLSSGRQVLAADMMTMMAGPPRVISRDISLLAQFLLNAQTH